MPALFLIVCACFLVIVVGHRQAAAIGSGWIALFWVLNGPLRWVQARGARIGFIERTPPLAFEGTPTRGRCPHCGRPIRWSERAFVGNRQKMLCPGCFHPMCFDRTPWNLLQFAFVVGLAVGGLCVLDRHGRSGWFVPAVWLGAWLAASGVISLVLARFDCFCPIRRSAPRPQSLEEILREFESEHKPLRG